MKETTLDEALLLFDEEVHTDITDMLVTKEATHLVVYQNTNVTSSEFGATTAVAIGPTCTRKNLDDANHHLYDFPSERQYPTLYVDLTKIQT